MQRVTVQTMKKENEHYVVNCDKMLKEATTKELKAGQRMLVDSDGLAFVYIVEDEDQFFYVSFDQGSWNGLKQAYVDEMPIVMNVGDGELLELEGFHTELEYLLENIEGNSNYGVELESSVLEVFGQRAE